MAPHGPLPSDWRIALDSSTQRIDGGAVLVGGTPLRLLRLTDAGTRLVDRLTAGEPVPRANSAQRLARRLLEGGLAHPRPGRATHTRDDVTIVVPARDGAGMLSSTLASLGHAAVVVVVDDGSQDDAVARAGAAAGAAVLRHERSRGPAAARNTGWRQATTDLVAFVDADCRPSARWIEGLVAHFDDPTVAAVAPRITTTVPPSLPRPFARYEEATPSLDRGADEAIVRPRSKVPFVPTATLVVRRAALDASGGFDETLRVGEDVDFVWRLGEAGWSVRYEPSVTVSHAARASVGAWVRQRFEYGTSAAALARRHPHAVAPLAVSPWSALAWGLIGLGAPVSGGVVAAGTTALLAPRLDGLQHPWTEAARLAGKGHLYAGLSVAGAVRRSWWPLAAVAALASRRARLGVLAAVVVPSLLEWRRLRPRLGPVPWTLIRLADDVVYGSGVWRGCLRERSVTALVPDLISWPGHRPAVESAADVLSP